MAVKVPLKPVLNMASIFTAQGAKTLSLNAREFILISTLLAYVASHGPAFYGTKMDRTVNVEFDQFIHDTAEKIGFSPSHVYTKWESIIADNGEDKDVTLTGSEARLLRSLAAATIGKGDAYFGVNVSDPDEKDTYESIVSSIVSKLSA